ncbi:hypothetical protein AB4Y32_34820 [Paraburkholderia phymatum]|uniref:Uncharacterized protein n=1 Tax=Paraburkholderia phymatum TaxID=148447 RepID=A0ACC6UBL6_9BURK
MKYRIREIAPRRRIARCAEDGVQHTRARRLSATVVTAATGSVIAVSGIRCRQARAVRDFNEVRHERRVELDEVFDEARFVRRVLIVRVIMFQNHIDVIVGRSSQEYGG